MGSALLDAVKGACLPGVWSRGVELARAEAVTGVEEDDDRVQLRVVERGGLISRTVELFLDDLTWDCTCGTRPVCPHVAAAAIALEAAREEGGGLPRPAAARGRLVYRFQREPGGLALHRAIEAGDRTVPFEATLAALAAGRVPGVPAFESTQADLAVERALGTHRRGPLPRGLVAPVLSALRKTESVSVEGTPVRTDPAPWLPTVLVEDAPGGFLVRLLPRSEAQVFTNGMALADGALRPMGDPLLTPQERAELPPGRFVSRTDVAQLTHEWIPSLRKRGLPVEVRTDALPGVERLPLRVALDLTPEGISVAALATLVYGDPPHARVDPGGLVHLQGALPVRDEVAEAALARRVVLQLGLTPNVRAHLSGEAAVALVARLSEFEAEAPLAVRGAGREAFTRFAPLVPQVHLRGDDLEAAFASGSRHAAAADVLRAWREGASLVPLQGGGWAPLPLDWLSRFGDRLADLLEAREAGGGTLPRAALPDLGRLAEALEVPPPPGLTRLRALVEGFTDLPHGALPADLTAELRPYQRRGVDWLAFLRDAEMGAMLADDMGLGKTLQALCALRGRTLVVAPTSVLPNWRSEIARFRPGLSVALYHGPRRKLDETADVTITSYALLRLDQEMLASTEWDAVVLDEAQAIKNPDSQVASAAFSLRARWRLTLTGTPVENRLEELWSQMHFLHPGFLGGRRDFEERVAGPMAAGREDVALRLRERVRPFILRRLKQEVAPELPSLTDAVLWCELTDEERRVYEAVRAATRKEVVEKLQSGGNVLSLLEALLRLRQAACHTGLVPGQQAETSSKVERLMEVLDTVVAEGHKALVFSQWTSLLDRIEPHLAAAGMARVRLDGSTVDRGGVVASFQDPAGPPVMLASLKAGGTGLNLTAADHVFLLDPWWNPAVEDQAAGRAHRIGQERPVLLYRLVAEDTVEERILALQESKRALAAAALEGTGGGAALTREDLLALLD